MVVVKVVDVTDVVVLDIVVVVLLTVVVLVLVCVVVVDDTVVVVAGGQSDSSMTSWMKPSSRRSVKSFRFVTCDEVWPLAITASVWDRHNIRRGSVHAYCKYVFRKLIIMKNNSLYLYLFSLSLSLSLSFSLSLSLFAGKANDSFLKKRRRLLTWLTVGMMHIKKER